MRRARAALVTATVVGLLGLIVPATSASAAPVGRSTDPAIAAPARFAEMMRVYQQIAAADHEQVTPMTYTLNPDGSIVGTVDRAALAKQQPGTMQAATVPCGNACNGHDPNSYITPQGLLCAGGAYTVTSVWVTSKNFAQLRYSPDCETAWTRGEYSDLMGKNLYQGILQYYVYNWSGHLSGPNMVWTAMLNDQYNYLYVACVDAQAGGPPSWACTYPY